MAGTFKVFQAINRERQIQLGRWGNEHDDSHSAHEWANVMGAYMGRINTELLGLKPPPTDEAALRALEFDETALRMHIVKLVTTGVAWIEAIDRRSERQ